MTRQNKIPTMPLQIDPIRATLQVMAGEQKSALRLAIRQRREEIDVSQEELARRLDVSVQTVGRWERGNGKKGAAFSRLDDIAEALETTAQELNAKALLIAGHPTDQAAGEDDLRGLLLSMRGQLADLQAKVARVENLQATMNKNLPHEPQSPEDSDSP
jgi:transcriptional regulator with XRE-family HTH domain